MGIREDVPVQSAIATITELREAPLGLLVVAERGVTKIEFIAKGSWIKDQLHIGQVVRATIKITES